MIQPNELRIGNYVDYEGQIKPVLAIDGENEYKEMGYKGCVTLPEYLPNTTQVWTTTGRWCAKINPIPITPEILERCDGFFVDDMNYNSDKENYCMSVNEDTYLHINSKTGATKIGSYEHSADANDGTVTTTFYIQDTQYLHQLQNLIFALSGIELTFETK
jgi:hypothetical protein